MAMRQFDAIVVGAGGSGMRAAIEFMCREVPDSLAEGVGAMREIAERVQHTHVIMNCADVGPKGLKLTPAINKIRDLIVKRVL